jgi:hypothetical protein
LPEDATTVAPVRAALLHATAVGLVGPPEPPKLRLMTWATGFACSVRVKGETESSSAMIVSACSQPPTDGRPRLPGTERVVLHTV